MHGDLQWPFLIRKVLFASPIAKSSLRQLIAYAKKERKEIALGTEHAVVGSKIMSFGLGSFPNWLVVFIPTVLTRTVSRSFNRMVSKAVPQKEDDLT